MSAYAQIADLSRFGLPAAALASVPDADKTKAISAASAIADGYIAASIGVTVLGSPLLASWGDDLTRAVVGIANYDLLSSRGYNPAGSGSDANVRMRYDDAIAWFANVAAGKVHPIWTPSVTQEPNGFDAPRMVSYPKQGW